MDSRTIGQILSSPDWLRQTLAEERPIQASNDIPGMLQGGPTYQQTAPTYPYQQPAPAGFAYAPPVSPYPPSAPTPAMTARPESAPVEVRGTIAYVARFRAEYFNERDPLQMQALTQAVIMGETGAMPGE